MRPIAHVLAIFSLQDPNKPKRAMSSFFLYSQANRQRTKEANPTATFGEIVSSYLCLFCSEELFLWVFEVVG